MREASFRNLWCRMSEAYSIRRVERFGFDRNVGVPQK
jgi:hypothetical protein